MKKVQHEKNVLHVTYVQANIHVYTTPEPKTQTPKMN